MPTLKNESLNLENVETVNATNCSFSFHLELDRMDLTFWQRMKWLFTGKIKANKYEGRIKPNSK